jgi:copper(I)-binding protein
MRALLLIAALLAPSAALARAPVIVSKPWMRYLLPSVPAAGYMVLSNDTDSDAVLTGAESPACTSVMLHQSTDTSGMAMMMMVPAITIPAHASFTLAPGGYHLMCMDPLMKKGENVDVTLMFKDGSKLAVTLPVYGAQDAP